MKRWYGFDDGFYAAAPLLEILGIEGPPQRRVFEDFLEGHSTRAEYRGHERL